LNNFPVQNGLTKYKRIYMDQERLLRITEVQQRVGIARSTIWLWIKQGRFPKGMKLSPSVTVWYEKEINLYVSGKWNA